MFSRARICVHIMLSVCRGRIFRRDSKQIARKKPKANSMINGTKFQPC